MLKKFKTRILMALIGWAILCCVISCSSGKNSVSNTSYRNTTEYDLINFNAGKDTFQYQIFPSPFSEQIEALIEENPWYGTRNMGDCGTGSDEGTRKFRSILVCASLDGLLPFLKHRSRYVREAVHWVLDQMKDHWIDQIKASYVDCDARIKLELLDYVEPHASDKKRFTLLDEIIANRDLSVFSSDHDQLRRSKAFKGLSNSFTGSVLNYPFDIVGYYVRILEDPFPYDRYDALNYLSLIGPDAERAVPALVEFIKCDDIVFCDQNTYWFGEDSENAMAALALARIGIASDDVISALEICREKSPYANSYATCALYKLGYHKDDQLEFLKACLEDRAYKTYHNGIIICLGLIGPDARSAISLIEPYVTDEDSTKRYLADNALTSIKGADASLIDHLKLLNNDDPDVRMDTIADLGNNADAPGVKDAILDLIRNDPDSTVVFDACTVFENDESIDRKLLLDGYVRVLQLEDGRDPVTCTFALSRIAAMNAVAGSAIPALIEFLGTEDDIYISSTVEVIIAVGGGYDAVVDKLIFATQNNIGNRFHAIYALGELGNNAVKALPVLINELNSSADILSNGFDKDAYSVNCACNEVIRQILKSCLKSNTNLPEGYLDLIRSCKSSSVTEFADKFR